jgi:hypothetical protein
LLQDEKYEQHASRSLLHGGEMTQELKWLLQSGGGQGFAQQQSFLLHFLQQYMFSLKVPG